MVLPRSPWSLACTAIEFLELLEVCLGELTCACSDLVYGKEYKQYTVEAVTKDWNEEV